MFDCAIIGAGPAGMAAAVQLVREGFSVVVFECHKAGGLLRNARLIENYLGFPDGISGKDLVKIFCKQLNRFSVEIVREEITNIKHDDGIFFPESESGIHKARSVIIATGTQPKKLGIKGGKELAGTRLFYDVADLPEFSNGTSFIVIGAGDVAFDYAISLHDRGYVPEIVTRDIPHPLKLLEDEVRSRGIKIHTKVEVLSLNLCNEKQNVDLSLAMELSPSSTGFNPSRNVKNIKINSKVYIKTTDSSFLADVIVVAIGRDPNTIVTPKNVDGVFFAGDVLGSQLRYVHVVTDGGISAAMCVTDFLRSC